MAFVERFLTSCSSLAIATEPSARLPLGVVIVIAESLVVVFRLLPATWQAKTTPTTSDNFEN